jgi:hypothetical protein
MDLHRGNPKFLRSADDPHGDFATICNQYFFNLSIGAHVNSPNFKT